MSTFDTLPVILVSATNEAVATKFITELIDNDVTDDYLKDSQSSDRIWRLLNKYYTANVRVHILPDHGSLDVDPGDIEAHIIHITEEEAGAEDGGTEAAAARAAGGTWRRAAVRVLACGGASARAALHAWGAAARAHVVPLREAPAPPHAPHADAVGAARVRAALHAHVWRGLQRAGRAAPAYSSSEESEGEAEAEERAVAHAETFAAALGSLGPALAERGPAGAERLERAEQLVAAFCRALGYDLGAC